MENIKKIAKKYFNDIKNDVYVLAYKNKNPLLLKRHTSAIKSISEDKATFEFIFKIPKGTRVLMTFIGDGYVTQSVFEEFTHDGSMTIDYNVNLLEDIGDGEVLEDEQE